MKQLFEMVSTSFPNTVIVHVFVELLYEIEKESVMNARSQAVLSVDQRLESSAFFFGEEHPGAQVIALDSAPSVRRRNHRLRGDSPASWRRPVRVTKDDTRVSLVSRVVTGVLSVLGVIVLGGVGAGIGLMSSAGGYEGSTTVHAVTAGESIWSIAQSVSTRRPLDEVVTDIRELNSVEGALYPGELLKIPLN